MSNKITKRSISEETSFRALEENGKKYLEGYASVFNQKSKLLYENGRFFYEVIDPKAFDEVLREKTLDVYLTMNHSRDRVIARTISGTLNLSVDEKGLLFRAELPNVSYANDVYELVSRGDLYENSFAFVVRKGDDAWSEDKDGNAIRLIKRVSKLIDVSVVTSGAYANTTVSARDADIKLKRAKTITITISDDEEEPAPEDMPEDMPMEEEPTDASTGENAIDASTGEEQDTEENACKKKKRDDDEAVKAELRKLQMYIQTLKLKY